MLRPVRQRAPASAQRHGLFQKPARTEEDPPMSVYFIVQEEIHDAAAMEQYGPKARLAPHSGKVIAVDDAPVAVEGNPHGSRVVIIEFEDEAAFHAWYDSPEYQEAAKIRLAATDSRSVLVHGMA
jgi:uncharacterized protein (DUF1330 family)